MKQFLFYLWLLAGLLAACTATTDVATVQPTRQIEATKTAVSTATLPPVATETTIPATPEVPATAVSTEQPLPPPSTLPAEDEFSFATAGHFAFVQDKNLYIQTLDRMTPPVLVERCTKEKYCVNLYLKWSVDGQYLLYFHTEDYDFGEIRLATLDGKWRTIGTDAHLSHPAAWSPNGKQIVYLRDTKTTQATPVDIFDENDELITINMELPLMEVVVIPFENGTVGDIQIKGTLTLGQPGCGGTFASDSAMLYGNEEGTALGYSMGILEWTAQDILLFTSNCTNVGIDRYDLINHKELDPLNKPVRNLVLSPDKTQWYGVSGVFWPPEEYTTELVTGDPTNTAVSTIPTSMPVEMIFMGQQSGDLFITSRKAIDYDDEEERTHDGYNFFESSLWRVNQSGTETAVYTGAAYALAHVQEAADGTLTFVQIENNIAQYEATKIDDSRTTRDTYMPRRHIVTLNQAGELFYLRPDAGSLSVTP